MVMRGNDAVPSLSKAGHKKKRPHRWGHPKEAREGGKVREGDAYQPSKQGRNGDVEIVRRGLKSFG